MSVVRMLPRCLVLLSLAFLAACAGHHPGGSGNGNPCLNGNGSSSRQAPIVCVDDSARVLSVSPEPVTVHDVLESDRRSPVAVHWYTKSGAGDLQLEIAPGCVTPPQCDGRGHCWARSLPGATGKCKYDVWIEGGRHDRLDPTIVLSTCCS